MLPAQYRLKSKKRFNEIFRRGRTAANDVLMVKYAASEKGDLRIGFSIGMKFSKKASRRNKAKRWLREAVREIIEQIGPGRDIIFLINPKFPYEQINYDLIRERVGDLLGRAKLLK